jgi:hypothetical protein
MKNKTDITPHEFSFNVKKFVDFDNILSSEFNYLSDRLVEFNKGLFLYSYQKKQNNIRINDYFKDDEDLINQLHSKRNIENGLFECEPNVVNVFNERFYKIFQNSHDNEMYYMWCSFKAYIANFENRLKQYNDSFIGTEKLDFIKFEYAEVLCAYNILELNPFIDQRNLLIIEKAKAQKIEHFNEFLTSKNLQAKVLANNFKSNQQIHIDFIDKDSRESTELLHISDLSESSATEKIIYLQKLGIIDFLRTKQPFSTSVNSLATILSSLTGEKSTTLQPMLNAMLSPNVSKKNNPLKSKTGLTKVEKTLIQIGFESK